MARIKSRKVKVASGLLVEEINLFSQEIICKFYRNGRATKFWSPALNGYSG